MTGQIITVPDAATDNLSPEFSAASARAGIRHSLSIGLATMQGTTGALNMYGTGEPFDDAARDVAVGFAAHAAVAVGNAAVYAGAVDEVEQMRTAMASRAVIEQARASPWPPAAAPLKQRSASCAAPPVAPTANCATLPKPSSTTPPAPDLLLISSTRHQLAGDGRLVEPAAKETRNTWSP